MGLHLHLLRIGNEMLLRSRLYASVGAPTHARSLLTTVTAGPRGRRKLKPREGVADAGRHGEVGRRSRGEFSEIDTGRMPAGSQLKHHRGGSGNNKGGGREG